MNDIIPNQRHLFDIPDDVAYLNCAYFSPQLRTVQESGFKGVERKNHPWRIGPEDFFSETEKARELFARIVSAPADHIAVIPSVSYGVSLAASALHLRQGQEILVLAEQFPSNVYPWRELAAKSNGSINTVARPRDLDWTSAILDAISPLTAIVALPIVHWTDGSKLEMQRISSVCRERNIRLVIDGTQSVGAMPVSIHEIEPDFLITAAYKWLLGPYSFGFMYVRPEHHTAAPIEYNWINRRASENFAGLVNYRDEFQDGARRFDVGEKSNFALTPMVLTALQQILTWQVDCIEVSIAQLTDALAESVCGLGLQVIPKEKRCGHILGIRFPDGLPNNIAKRLSESGVYVSIRGNAMRVAPHLFNTQADLGKLVGVLEKTV